MDNKQHLFKHLRQNSKRILSIMLAFAIFAENPLSAYASAATSNIATSSNASEGDYIDEIDDKDLGKDPDYIKGLEDTINSSYVPRPVVDASTIPDEIEVDEDGLDEILGAGANCIDDFDPDSLVPLTPEQIKAIQDYVPQDSDPNDNLIASADISTHVAVVDDVALAIMAIMFAVGCSGVVPSVCQKLSDMITTLTTNSFSPADFTYTVNGVQQKVTITQVMIANLKNKLKNAISGNEVSVSLTEEDKQAYAYVAYREAKRYSQGFGLNYALASINKSSIKIKDFDGYPYYYFYAKSPDNAFNQGNTAQMIYTPEKGAFGLYDGHNLTLYYRSAVLADGGFMKMKVRNVNYLLNVSSGLYEYNGGTLGNSLSDTSDPTAFMGIIYSMPFPISLNSDSSNGAQQAILDKDMAAIIANTISGRIGSLDMLFNLKTATMSSDYESIVNSEKNAYATVTGLNPAAGLVLEPGTTTKPGEGTTTKPGESTGSGSSDNDGNKDYSGSLTQIIGSLASIVASVAILQNILTAINDMPGTLAQKIAAAVDNGVLAELVRSIKNAIETVKGWDIEGWLTDCADAISDTFERCVSRITDILEDLPTADILETIISSVLSGSALTAAVIAIKNLLEKGNIINFGDEYKSALSSVLTLLGLGSLASLLQMVIDVGTDGFGKVVDGVSALEDALAGLGTGITLGELADALENLLTTLGLGSIGGILSGILEVVSGMSVASLIEAIRALPASIVIAVAEAIPNWFPNEPEKKDDGSGFFKNLLNIFTLLIMIVIALLILFTNCLKFIFNIYQIPASSTLFNDDILKGLDFLKSLEITFPNTAPISIFDLLIACAYFVIFMSIIAMLRRKIDKIHL